MGRRPILSAFTVFLLVAAFALLLLPNIAAPATDLSLVRVRLVGSDSEVLLGSFGAGIRGVQVGEERLRLSTNTWTHAGSYVAGIGIPYQAEGYGGSPSYTAWSTYYVTTRDTTAGLFVFPVSIAIIGIAIIFCIWDMVRNSRGARAAACVLSGVAMILAWTAWGFAYALTGHVQARIDQQRFTGREEGELTVERGDAVWPALVGCICLTLATVSATLKAIIGWLTTDEEHEMRQEKGRDASGELGGRDRINNSDITLA